MSNVSETGPFICYYFLFVLFIAKKYQLLHDFEILNLIIFCCFILKHLLLERKQLKNSNLY